MLRQILLSLASVLAILILGSMPSFAAVLVVDCNGGGNFTTIGAAINGSNANDTIVVHPCAYPENLTILGKNDLHLVAAHAILEVGAAPAGVGALPANQVMIAGTGIGNCLNIIGSHRASVTGFVFDSCMNHGIYVESSNSVRIHANVIGPTQGSAMLVKVSNGAVLTSNWLHSSNADPAIHFSDSHFAIIADNELHGGGGPGIQLEGTSKKNQILRNEIHNHFAAGIDNQAIRTRIERNSITGNCSNGLVGCGCSQILVHGGAANTDVIGNQIGAGGLAVCNGSQVEVEDNS